MCAEGRASPLHSDRGIQRIIVSDIQHPDSSGIAGPRRQRLIGARADQEIRDVIESADGLVSIEQSSDASFEKPTDRTERPHRRADNVQRQVVRAQRGHRPYRADLTDARAPAAKFYEFDERDNEIHENVPTRPRRIYRLERHTPDLKFGGRADGDAAFALQDFARLSGDV